jgi:signal transduction histidine kinase
MQIRTGQDLILTHSLLLGERLLLFARLRFIAAGGIVAAALFATYVVGIRGLNVGALTAAAAFLAASNGVMYSSVRGIQGQPADRRLVLLAHLSIFIDYVVLTFAIWQVGGSHSPFLAFYLLHAILSSVLLSRKAAYGHAAVGYLLLAGLVLGEWSKLIPVHRPAGAVPGGPFDFRIVLTVLFVYALLTAVTTVLTTGIVARLRKGEQDLRAATERMQNLADLRRSFLHVVLHDIRSPVATVVTMLDGVTTGVDGEIEARPRARVERATVRLRGVLEQMRGLRVLADLETEQLDTLMAPVDVNAVLRDLLDENQEAAQQQGHRLELRIPSTLAPVRAVDRLLREAVANYLSNAFKYAVKPSTVVLAARQTAGVVRIEVIDEGPGIAAVEQGRLFREFSRLKKSGQGAGGMGLGLSIVRRIAEVHGGLAGVESAVGQGSVFFIELPAEPR